MYVECICMPVCCVQIKFWQLVVGGGGGGGGGGGLLGFSSR